MFIMNKRVRVVRLITVILTVIVIWFLALRISSFVHIFGTHAGNALTQQQVLDAYKTNQVDASSPVVPRIIHQIFHNWTDPEDESLPADWTATRQTCLDLNPEWQHWVKPLLGLMSFWIQQLMRLSSSGQPKRRENF